MKRWEQAWLEYRPQATYEDSEYFLNICCQCNGKIVESAIKELKTAAQNMFGKLPKMWQEDEGFDKGIVLRLTQEAGTGAEGFSIYTDKAGRIVIEADEEAGLLHGTFRLILTAARSETVVGRRWKDQPDQPLRMLNHWDNMDGSIERGYSGRSFFYEQGKFLSEERIYDYARLIASIGINAVVINNVNVKHEAIELITPRYLPDLKKIDAILGAYGIRLFLSLDFAAPVDIGGMDTADPLNVSVAAWWKETLSSMFQELPNLGGFLVKADSEGRPGPFTYERSHADGANMLARAVVDHGGLIIWRCFVYNCQQDWRDRTTDRARAGYDNFLPLDGQFLNNVILQIKNGPMDFQVREPVHPLFGALSATNQMLEVQAAQEYTGQQRHVCYLVPMWKEVLDFHTHCGKLQDTVGDIISGKTYGNMLGGMAAVSNTGADANWTGHDLAGANLYGYGRLTWKNSLSAEDIATEWIQLALTSKPEPIKLILKLLLNSWPAYESYTSPLGIGWMVNPNHHYGPNVDGYEYDRWGTYHRADHLGIGVDRTLQGTGYAALYNCENRAQYESPTDCPDELILFFHHVPYSHILHSGKTVIQHIYDSHFHGAEMVEDMITLWKQTENALTPNVYQRVLKRLQGQLEHSQEWRDVINSYFYRKTLIEDSKNRVIY